MARLTSDSLQFGQSPKTESANQSEEPGDEDPKTRNRSGSEGSLGSINQIREDYNQNSDTRTTGYMGKMSDVAWMRRLRDHTDLDGSDSESEDGTQFQPDPGTTPFGTTGYGPAAGTSQGSFTTKDSSYHHEEAGFLAISEVREWDFPLPRTIHVLVQLYFQDAHPIFPILGQTAFTDQIGYYASGIGMQHSSVWVAKLNLVLAIAAKYKSMLSTDHENTPDHAVYFARARKILSGDDFIQSPDLERVQATGLMSFYMMSVNQINK